MLIGFCLKGVERVNNFCGFHSEGTVVLGDSVYNRLFAECCNLLDILFNI